MSLEIAEKCVNLLKQSPEVRTVDITGKVKIIHLKNKANFY